MKKLPFIVVLIALFSLAIFADVRLPELPTPKPTPKNQKTVYFSVKIDESVTDAKIEIPKSLLKYLKKQIAEIEVENGEENTAEIDETPADKSASVQTIMFGTLLSLGFIFGGVWFVRKGKSNATATIIVVTALVSISATAVFANIAPPIIRNVSSFMFSDEVKNFGRGGGRVSVKVSNGNEILLTVPVDQRDKKSGE
jgi:hypothetical protein